jgi:hypothetical protein
VALQGGVLRWDLPDWGAELPLASEALTLTYNVTYTGKFAGGFAFTAANVALQLPDGTLVEPRKDWPQPVDRGAGARRDRARRDALRDPGRHPRGLRAAGQRRHRQDDDRLHGRRLTPATRGAGGAAGSVGYTLLSVFDTLSDRLRRTLATLTGRGRVSEADVDAAMREIRLSLLEADVNFRVVKDFVARVREQAIGPRSSAA